MMSNAVTRTVLIHFDRPDNSQNSWPYHSSAILGGLKDQSWQACTILSRFNELCHTIFIPLRFRGESDSQVTCLSYCTLPEHGALVKADQASPSVKDMAPAQTRQPLWFKAIRDTFVVGP